MNILKKMASGLNAAWADLMLSLRKNQPEFELTPVCTGYQIEVRKPDGSTIWYSVKVTNAHHARNLFSEMVRWGLRQKYDVVGVSMAEPSELFDNLVKQATK